MKIKPGDCVKVKKGGTMDGESTDGWQGVVIEKVSNDTFQLLLDAPTLEGYSDEYMQSILDNGGNPFMSNFKSSDLELTKQRDNSEEMEAAIERVVGRMTMLGDDTDFNFDDYTEEEYFERKELWMKEFISSPFSEELGKKGRENAEFVLSTFMDIGFNHIDVFPGDWEDFEVGEICLEYVPKKISAEPDLFKVYGEVLIKFFSYLGANGLIENLDELIVEVEACKDLIFTISQDGEGWGISKSIMMGALDAGIDLSDETAIENYVESVITAQNDAKKPSNWQDPFKSFNRNEKVSVKYEDGKVLKDVKFKKVQGDLRSGKCEMI